MCRNIKPLFNFDPPVTDEEVRAACLQFVRKISGFTKPSKVNQAAFDAAVEGFSEAARGYLKRLESPAAPRSRQAWEANRAARQATRFPPGARST